MNSKIVHTVIIALLAALFLASIALLFCIGDDYDTVIIPFGVAMASALLLYIKYKNILACVIVSPIVASVVLVAMDLANSGM